MPQEHFNLRTTPVRSVLAYRQGLRGLGVFQLQLGLEWRPQRHDGWLARAQVWFAGIFGVSFAGGMRYPIGPLQSIYPFEMPSEEPGSGSSCHVDVAVYLAPEQLERIEEARGGGPITLHLELQGIVFPTPRIEPPPAFRADLSYELTAAEWVEQLERWQYARGLLIQVPTFGQPGSPRAAKAYATLERAIKDLTEGDYEAAVGRCRDALEQSYGPDDPKGHPELGTITNLKTASKEARVWLIRRGLWALTNAAKHSDEVTDAIEWRRADAMAAINFTASLLQQDPPT